MDLPRATSPNEIINKYMTLKPTRNLCLRTVDERPVPEPRVSFRRRVPVRHGLHVLRLLVEGRLRGETDADVGPLARLRAVAVLDLDLVALPAVRLLVEVGEEEVEHDRVHADPPDEGLRVVAVDEKQLEGVDHHQDELHHLDGGEVLLPPEVLLVLRAQRGQEVVGVHDDVHEGVEEAEEGRVPAGGELHAEPHRHRHHAVVDHVQGGDVVVLLTQDEEDLATANTRILEIAISMLGFWSHRIQELREFGEVVPPTASSHLKKRENFGQR